MMSNKWCHQFQWLNGLGRGSVVVCLLGLRVRLPLGACMYVCCEHCVCYLVEVSATGRLHVQRRHTDCDVSLCVI